MPGLRRENFGAQRRSDRRRKKTATLYGFGKKPGGLIARVK
jgi:hypothetical protein